MKTSATNKRIRVLMAALRDETLLPRPEFQRRLVWTNRHKERFLETVLMNYPFPEIYIASGDIDADTGMGVDMLVDGQQRVTTLSQYFLGSEDLQLRQILPYSKLSQQEKLAFLEYEVVVRDLGRKSISEITDVFQRINSTQYSLNAMEIRNARYDGDLKSYIEGLSRHTFFSRNNVFRTNDIRRMGDLVFSLTIVITVISGYFNRDDLLGDFLERYNDEFPLREEVDEQLDGTFSIIDKCQFQKNSRVWRKADLFTLIIELHRLRYVDNIDISIQPLRGSLKEFYAAVDAARESEDSDKEAASYHRFAVQGTNDRVNRSRRGHIIARVLRRSQGIVTEQPEEEAVGN